MESQLLHDIDYINIFYLTDNYLIKKNYPNDEKFFFEYDKYNNIILKKDTNNKIYYLFNENYYTLDYIKKYFSKNSELFILTNDILLKLDEEILIPYEILNNILTITYLNDYFYYKIFNNKYIKINIPFWFDYKYYMTLYKNEHLINKQQCVIHWIESDYTNTIYLLTKIKYNNKTEDVIINHENNKLYFLNYYENREVILINNNLILEKKIYTFDDSIMTYISEIKNIHILVLNQMDSLKKYNNIWYLNNKYCVYDDISIHFYYLTNIISFEKLLNFIIHNNITGCILNLNTPFNEICNILNIMECTENETKEDIDKKFLLFIKQIII